jgi:hypothetical protein
MIEFIAMLKRDRKNLMTKIKEENKSNYSPNSKPSKPISPLGNNSANES